MTGCTQPSHIRNPYLSLRRFALHRPRDRHRHGRGHRLGFRGGTRGPSGAAAGGSSGGTSCPTFGRPCWTRATDTVPFLAQIGASRARWARRRPGPRRAGGTLGNFPLFAAHGTRATAVVYFELEPGRYVPMHTDSAEEVLLILQGTVEATVGEEAGHLSRGGMVVIPPMVHHQVHNVGNETARVVGFFTAATVVSTFDQPLAPSGERVFDLAQLMEQS